VSRPFPFFETSRPVWARDISHNAGKSAEESIMAKLALCFRDKEKHRSLTSTEIESVAMAAYGVSAIIHVMGEYLSTNPQEEDSEGVYSSVFNVLELLMEPITDYLNEYAGTAAAPEQENEPETT
jgi:hypothetical protein